MTANTAAAGKRLVISTKPLEAGDSLRLARVNAAGGLVVSLYIDLDPARYPHVRDRQMQVDSLLTGARRRRAEAGAGSEADDPAIVEGEVERVREAINDALLTAPGARAVAVFSSSVAGTLEALAIPEPIKPFALIDAAPAVGPLLSAGITGGWCAVLLDRRGARLLCDMAGSFVDMAEIDDHVHGWHKQGGWSQARYQRAIEHDVGEHVKHVAEELVAFDRTRRFERLAVGASAELTAMLLNALPADLRDRFAERIEVDAGHATVEQVRAAVAALAHEQRDARCGELLDRIAEGVGTGSEAVAGLDPVLAALADGNVATLAVVAGFSARGTFCAGCGLLAGGPAAPCPRDGRSPVVVEDVIERAIGRALTSSAKVERADAPEHVARLADLGSIAAILRH